MSNNFDYKSDIGILATEIDPVDVSTNIIGMGAQGSTNSIDLSTYSFNWNTANTASYTISAGSTGSYYTSIDTRGFNGIEIKDGADIKIGERSLSKFMDQVESRLAILQPKPELLEKFEALKQAYEQYKLLESLCTGNIPKSYHHDK